MAGTGIATWILIIANIIISYRGFTNQAFFDGYKFEVDSILLKKDYIRLLSSGFLHLGWVHLIFNMMSLYVFSELLEAGLGTFKYLVIYFTGLVGGNLFALYIHRHHGDYSAAGASGAVCGLIFASIALYPGIGIGFFGLPFYIPSWIYGLVYVLFTVYGIRADRDNIGHEAHLGGALAGMAVALLMEPQSLADNYPTILIITLPAIGFIYLLVTRPALLLVGKVFSKPQGDHYSIDHQYNQQRHNRQQEIDAILDKINRKGMSSLTRSEKEKLEQYGREGGNE